MRQHDTGSGAEATAAISDVASGPRADRPNMSGERGSDSRIAASSPVQDDWTTRRLNGVQGLRTVAALLVAAYHIWFHRVSGGVDVFFVVAGFFAARSIRRMVDSDSLVNALRQIGDYWARTARRVVPSATLVILATTVVAVLRMPVTMWDANTGHAFASLFFYENWHLISTGSDYNQQATASPFQQFWALSIQVQSYLVVPLLVLLAIVLSRLIRARARVVTMCVLALGFVASFAYSVHYTATNQQASYFSLASRLWEFLAGALFFFAMTKWRGGARFARALGLVGLGVIVLYGAAFDLSRLLPGYHAVVLILATAALIFSSIHGAEPKILTNRAVLQFADASFTFYLWHWPILIAYRWYHGNDVGIIPGVGILALSAVLAFATTRWFERPIRFAPFIKKSAVVTIVACLLLMSVPFSAVLWWQSQTATRFAEVQSVEANTDWGFYPTPLEARTRWLTVHTEAKDPDGPCVVGEHEEGLIVCRMVQNPDSPRRIVAFGASHIYQWADALEDIAEDADVNLEGMFKLGCVPSTEGEPNACNRWYDNAVRTLLEDPPDVVVMTVTQTAVEGPEFLSDVKMQAVRTLMDAGIKVVGIRDSPRFEYGVPDCVEARGVEECARQQDDLYSSLVDLDLPYGDNFDLVDYSDRWCQDGVCPVVIDGVLAYVDDNHLSWAWTEANRDRLEVSVLRALVSRE